MVGQGIQIGIDRETNLIDKISDFVDEVRIQDDRRRQDKGSTDKDKTSKVKSVVVDRRNDLPSTSNASSKEVAAQMVLDAKKFRGEIDHPKGIVSSLNFHEKFFEGIPQSIPGKVFDDDDFMHVTCHVDNAIAAKIAKGEFIDVDKLLVKDKFRRQTEECLEFINHNGHTYLSPVAENKISGLRMWERAFRVYAMIYSKANPLRSAEIWQYIHTINTAAANFVWDNVAGYDYTCRQIMGQNLFRSWAKTHNQLWNLSM